LRHWKFLLLLKVLSELTSGTLKSGSLGQGGRAEYSIIIKSVSMEVTVPGFLTGGIQLEYGLLLLGSPWAEDKRKKTSVQARRGGQLKTGFMPPGTSAA
jgi:hypothetical protein